MFQYAYLVCVDERGGGVPSVLLSVPVRRHPLLPSVSSDHQISISSISLSGYQAEFHHSSYCHPALGAQWEPGWLSTSSSHQAPLERGERGDTWPVDKVSPLQSPDSTARPRLADCGFQLRTPGRLPGGKQRSDQSQSDIAPQCSVLSVW